MKISTTRDYGRSIKGDDTGENPDSLDDYEDKGIEVKTSRVRRATWVQIPAPSFTSFMILASHVTSLEVPFSHL